MFSSKFKIMTTMMIVMMVMMVMVMMVISNSFAFEIAWKLICKADTMELLVTCHPQPSKKSNGNVATKDFPGRVAYATSNAAQHASISMPIPSSLILTL